MRSSRGLVPDIAALLTLLLDDLLCRGRVAATTTLASTRPPDLGKSMAGEFAEILSSRRMLEKVAGC